MSVLTYETGFSNGKETYFFIVSVNCDSQEYTTRKRFSTFDELYDKLAKVYDNLPELPSKTLLKITKAADLDKRRQALEKFLKVSLL